MAGGCPMSIRIFFYVLIAASCSACAHVADVKNKPSAISKQEQPILNSDDNSILKAHNPTAEMTSEEVGLRFLKLIGSIKSVNDLTLENVRKVTQLPMEYSSESRTYLLSNELSETELYYSLNYYEDTKPKEKIFWYEDNRAGEKKLWLEFEAKDDKTPQCGIRLDTYASALKEMGFSMQIKSDKNGLSQSWDISKPTNVIVGYMVTDKSPAPSPDGDLSSVCVKSIFLFVGK
jgi:hypothetical protein